MAVRGRLRVVVLVMVMVVLEWCLDMRVEPKQVNIAACDVTECVRKVAGACVDVQHAARYICELAQEYCACAHGHLWLYVVTSGACCSHTVRESGVQYVVWCV